MIKIKPKFTDAQIRNYLSDRLRAIREAIFRRMQRVGENFVKNARSIDTYKDQTGNLRSSIGYIILYNGQEMDADFRVVKKDSNGSITTTKKGVSNSEAVNKAKNVVRRLIKENNYSHGFVLIVVCGMEYASAVESGFRGEDRPSATPHDVITGSSLIAKEELRKAMDAIQKKLDA